MHFCLPPDTVLANTFIQRIQRHDTSDHVNKGHSSVVIVGAVVRGAYILPNVCLQSIRRYDYYTGEDPEMKEFYKMDMIRHNES